MEKLFQNQRHFVLKNGFFRTRSENMSSAAVGDVGAGRAQDNPFLELSMFDGNMGNHSLHRKRKWKQRVKRDLVLFELNDH